MCVRVRIYAVTWNDLNIFAVGHKKNLLYDENLPNYNSNVIRIFKTEEYDAFSIHMT